MSTTTSIEWTRGDDGTPGRTWNPVTGCDRVSPGCTNCYALTMARRLKAMGNPRYGRDGDPRTSGPGFGVTVHPDVVNQPLKWRKPTRIFVNSMSDLFHKDVPDAWLADIFAVMAAARRHVFQVLTKRHGRARSLLNTASWVEQVRSRAIGKGLPADDWRWPIPGIWLGVSAEDQKRADLRIPALLDTPATVRFLSCEPLLGPVDLSNVDGLNVLHGDDTGYENGLHWVDGPTIHWVIVGGESGHGARPMHPQWAASLRDQCQDADVPFFFKQWGEWGPAPFIVRVCDPDEGWHGTPEELAAAKKEAEAAGATHVHTGNFYWEDSERVWSIHEIGHKPWSLERVGLPDGMEPIRRWGKKAAGRELDGRTWDEFPGAVVAS